MPSPWVFSVSERDFDLKVIQQSSTVPVVVDFWAPWCAPCRALAPTLERMVQERKGEVLLAKVNIDEEQNLAAQFGVESIPLVLAFRDGQPVLDFVGVLPDAELTDFFDRLTPSEADRKAKEAAALEAKDPERAEALYRQVLQKDANHEAAVLGLARLLIAEDKDEEALELAERVGPGGQQGAEAERLAAILWLRGQARDRGDEATLRARLEVDPGNPHALYDLGVVEAAAGRFREALDLLLQAGQRDLKLAKEKVREAMVKIFHAVGVRSEMADEYRQRLTSLLY